MNAPSLRVDHLAQPSFDARETHRFYTEVMGFRLLHALEAESEPWGGRRFLLTCYAAPDGTLVDFFQVEGIEPPGDDGLPRGIRHVAFSVASRGDLEAWRQRLRSRGVPFVGEDHGGLHASLYFTDPNGVQLELTHWARRYGEEDAARAPEVLRRWTESP